MRIFLIGPLGAGKSYIIKHIQQNYPSTNVYTDPIFTNGLHLIKNPLTAQAAIESSLFLRKARYNDGIFDTSLEMAKMVFSKLSIYDKTTREEVKANPLFILELEKMRKFYNALTHSLHDVYIIIDRSQEELKANIIKRGRPYEINNPVITRLNADLADDIVKDISTTYPGNRVIRVFLKGEDISPVIDVIKTLKGGILK